MEGGNLKIFWYRQFQQFGKLRNALICLVAAGAHNSICSSGILIKDSNSKFYSR